MVFLIRHVVEYDPTRTMLAMTILVFFLSGILGHWAIYSHTKVQPVASYRSLAPGAHLACQLAARGCAWFVLCALTTRKLAHGGKVSKGMFARTNSKRRLLWFWMGCVFGPSACYMALWALYIPKQPLWPLISRVDLAGDLLWCLTFFQKPLEAGAGN